MPQAHVDILKFAPLTPAPADRRVVLSLSPEVVAQIAANGLGLDLCASDIGPHSLWLETAKAVKAAKVARPV